GESGGSGRNVKRGAASHGNGGRRANRDGAAQRKCAAVDDGRAGVVIGNTSRRQGEGAGGAGVKSEAAAGTVDVTVEGGAAGLFDSQGAGELDLGPVGGAEA